MSESALAVITADPKQYTGKIKYDLEVLEEFGVEPVDVGIEPPKPN